MSGIQVIRSTSKCISCKMIPHISDRVCYKYTASHENGPGAAQIRELIRAGDGAVVVENREFDNIALADTTYILTVVVRLVNQIYHYLGDSGGR